MPTGKVSASFDGFFNEVCSVKGVRQFLRCQGAKDAEIDKPGSDFVVYHSQ